MRHHAHLVVPGTPRPKGSRTSGVNKAGVRFSRESNPRTIEWMKGARKAIAEQWQGPPLRPPYEVRLTFTFAPPKKRSWPRAGDIDKYSRAALDAAAGILIEDDRHVTILSAVKRYGEPSTVIEVEELS